MTSHLVVDCCSKFDAINLVHVSLKIDEANFGLLEVRCTISSLWTLLKLLVQIIQLLKVLKISVGG